MSVYLGDCGAVEIRREGEPVSVQLQAADVDTTEKRFSLDFDPTFTGTRPSPLITGDQVEFTRTDGSNLQLVAGMTDISVTRWVHVDLVGGIRLYNNYEDAINGGPDRAINLTTPGSDQDITVDVVNVNDNCVAQIRAWEITAQRETVDTSILGEEYRQFYDQGMVSGQGTITAIWDYKYNACTDDFPFDAELANYFSRLVIRFREGSRFRGTFTIFRKGADWVWYEADCICTSVGMNFAPGEIIQSTIQFITTGQIEMKQGQPPGYLLQEDDSEILLESQVGSLELESSV